MYFSTYSLLYSIALYIKLYIITNINMILNLYLCYTTNKTIIFSCCSKNKKLFPLDFDTVLYFIIQTLIIIYGRYFRKILHKAILIKMILVQYVICQSTKQLRERKLNIICLFFIISCVTKITAALSGINSLHQFPTNYNCYITFSCPNFITCRINRYGSGGTSCFIARARHTVKTLMNNG